MCQTPSKRFVCMVLFETGGEKINEESTFVASKHVCIYVFGVEMAGTWRFSCVIGHVFSLNRRHHPLRGRRQGSRRARRIFGTVARE